MIGAAMGLVSTPLRLKALIIGALAMVAVCLALTAWALLERAGRMEAKAELVVAQTQAQVWEGAAGRCTASVQELGAGGAAAIGETKRLLEMAGRMLERTAAVREEIRVIVKAPPPVRADGKPKDCADALGEIRKKVQP